MAKDIGLVIVDGNSTLVDDMIELDCSRIAASELNCKHASCSDPSSSKECPSSSAEFVSTITNTPDQVQDGNPENLMTDQEKGWSKVGPRKKKKNRK